MIMYKTFEKQLKLFDDSNYVIETRDVSATKKTIKKHEDPFRLELLDGMTLTDYGMPIVEPYDGAWPTAIIPFHEARADYNRHVTTTACPHFYIDDTYFTCVLKDLPKYTSILAGFSVVIGLDFSIKIDMPEPVKMYHSYLNKMATRYFQLHDVKVIPNVVWADPRSYDYCFAGFPTNSVVAVNSMGIIGNPSSVFFWQKGYEEMLKRLHPTHIIRYGDKIAGEDESISTYYPNNHLNRMRHGR